jgi:hypothetical protein
MKSIYVCCFTVIILVLSACGQSVSSVNVAGAWFQEESMVAVCGITGKMAVAFELEQTKDQNTVRGSISLMDGYGVYEGSFIGQVSSAAKLTGTAVFLFEEEFLMDISVTLNNSKLAGTMKAKTSGACEDGSYDKAVITLALQRVEQLPQPQTPNQPTNPAQPSDPRNPNTPVTTLELNKDYALTTSSAELSWFSFTLPTAQLVRLTMESSQGDYFSYNLFDKNNSLVLSESATYSVDNQKMLVPGIYYLSVQGIYPESKNYTLKLGATELADARYEPNDTVETATPLGSNFNADLYLYREAAWGPEGDTDVFTFTVSEESVVNVDLGDVKNVYYHLFAKGQEASSYVQEYRGKFSKGLTAGTYYLRFSLNYETSSLPYTLKFSTEAIPDKSLEPNNSLNNATSVSVPMSQTLYLGVNDEDWYTFSLTRQEVVTFKLSNLQDTAVPLILLIYNGSGQEVSRANFNDVSLQASTVHFLPAGQYYVKVGVDNTYSQTPSSYSYALSIQNEVLPDASLEPNNTLAEANLLELGIAKTLFLAKNDIDVFKIILDKTTQLTVSIEVDTISSSNLYFFSPKIIDSKGYETHSLRQGVQDVILTSGTHYLQLEDDVNEMKYRLTVTKK